MPTEQTHTHTHTQKSHTQETGQPRAMQQLLGISASSLSLERSCLVFSEWRCSFLCAQHNPVPRVQLVLAEILGSWSSVAVSSSLGVRSPLFIQQAKCMRHVVLSSMACLVLSNLPTLSDKRHDFRKKKLLKLKFVF